jgi:uncharacterized protein
LKAWPLIGLCVVQLILFLAHWFLYTTWSVFWPWLSAAGHRDLRIALFILAFTFVPAALLSFRSSNPLLRLFYNASVIWLGFLNFIFLAAVASWPVWFIVRLAGVNTPGTRLWINASLTAIAALAAIYGLINARRIRIRRHSVSLPNLPESWRGRRAVLLSDLHLGNVNGIRFARRMTRMTARLAPDIVFLPGDLFDGVHADLDRLLSPLRELQPPLGVYFCTGNHEEFGDSRHYTEPIARAGIRVLQNEKVLVDGVHIAGVSYRDSMQPIRLRSLLDGMSLNGGHPAILLNHVPSRLPIVERAGVSLQLSGHTHGGQLFPFSWITQRVFGKYTYGLNRFGGLQVYTSYGAGTWGPPMRVGTYPEIVALEFE